MPLRLRVIGCAAALAAWLAPAVARAQTLSYEITSVSIPSFRVDEAASPKPVTITLKNNGDVMWEPSLRDRLSTAASNSTYWSFGQVASPDPDQLAMEAGFTRGIANSRVFLTQNVAPGASTSVTFLVRPGSTVGPVAKLSVTMVRDGFTEFGPVLSYDVPVCADRSDTRCSWPDAGTDAGATTDAGGEPERDASTAPDAAVDEEPPFVALPEEEPLETRPTARGCAQSGGSFGDAAPPFAALALVSALVLARARRH